MTPVGFVLAIIVGLVIASGVILFLKSYYKTREIVTGISFDEPKKQLTIRSTTPDGQKFIRTHKYSDIRVKSDNLSDGITPPMYKTITLLNKTTPIGHIYKNHFTWDAATLEQIAAKLNDIRTGNEL